MPALTAFRSILTFALAVLYLGNVFLSLPLLNLIIMLLLVMIIILSFPFVSGSSKIIAYVTFFAGIILLVAYKAPLSVWTHALEENLYLVVMFAVVPLIGIPFKHGGYFDALQRSFQLYVNTDTRFYLLVSFLSTFVGILVNLAVVPMVYQISKASARSKNIKLLSSALSRGFTTCTIWAPTTAAVALVLQATGTDWIHFFPYALLCGILCGIVGLGLNQWEQGNRLKSRNDLEQINIKESSTLNQDIALSAPAGQWQKLIELAVWSIILIASIAVISHLTGIKTITVVSMASLVIPFLWMGTIKRLPDLRKAVKEEYYRVSLPKLKNEIILFMGAGLLATSIAYSHIGNIVPGFFDLFIGENIILLSYAIIFITVILSVIGVHPIISVAIFSSTIHAAAYHISPAYMAVILAMSWAMGITVSPSGAMVIGISGLTGVSPATIGPRWNLIYVVISTIVAILALTVIRLTGLL
ncbi:C4-dicarboxylate ABC transporter [Dehalobacter sp. DCM]|uniref:C4-dicarboxylate ABC transporter n=1 Tax=Dehalobacter sp. DCM TaxID=2907827 RepID=UPI003081CD0C|nr:C4-dicarboxylate ABC transporter [Dehalobacter sp. DCM]